LTCISERGSFVICSKTAGQPLDNLSHFSSLGTLDRDFAEDSLIIISASGNTCSALPASWLKPVWYENALLTLPPVPEYAGGNRIGFGCLSPGESSVHETPPVKLVDVGPRDGLQKITAGARRHQDRTVHRLQVAGLKKH
jgi:hypothetical protein